MAVSYKSICDTRCQKFYTEMFKNENLLRMKWFLKNQEKLLKNLEKQMEQDQPTEASARCEEQKSMWQNSLPQWRPLTPDGSVEMSIMKPIDPKVLDILYEKQVPSFITAENYIHERVKEPPENRYYYPDCTSWIYGWRLNDFPPITPSKVKRKGVVRREFWHPKISSLNRDPEWYRECRGRNVKSCRN